MRLYGKKGKPSRSASRAYWHLLNLGDATIESLEIEAVNQASVYDDVLPALAELKTLGIRRYIASSLSQAAIMRFLERCPHHFDGAWSRDTAAGVKAVPLRRALDQSGLEPGAAMFLTDTVEGLKTAHGVGVHSILMMNDPDESRRLTAYNPSGGIVSLHELPDFIRLVAAQNLR